MSEFFFDNWAEVVTVALLILGVFISVVSPSAFISYIIVFLSGMIAGRLLYERRNNTKFAYSMIILGYLTGFLVGALYHRGSPAIITILFAVGMIFCYRLYDKGVLHDTFF